jgi:aspartate/methionine/tyrosine aminotransferase
MKIKNFLVERWMDRYEHEARYNLAETCVESLTVDQLLTLTGKQDSVMDELRPMKLTYGAIEGSDRLRTNISALYERQTPRNIVVTHGAIGGNALVYKTLIEPDDRVIAVLPTYQQHYSLPESYGANMHTMTLREENGFLPDLDELRKLASQKTKLIAINNPNNPTGSLMDEAFLKEVVAIAQSCGAYLLCDEVYRGTDQDGAGFTASVADLYERGISTGSMSKTWSLAGLRLGWIAGPVDVIRAVCIHRDYNTISVGMIDDYLASIALEAKDAILARNHAITRNNLATLDAWVEQEPLVSYVKPKAATVCLLKFDVEMSSTEFCTSLIEATGVMFTPGSAFEMEGYVRIGFANPLDVLQQGLGRVSEFLKDISRK